jgi:hypothetical protein
MAAELGGLFLSGGILLAATTFAGRKRARQEDAESIARATSQARTSFDKEYDAALTRSIDTICLATRFDSSSAYQSLQRSLSSHLSVASEFVPSIEGEISSAPALDINLSFLLGNIPSFLKERELFQALAKEGILLCPGEARGLTTPGHFFVTAPVNSEKEVDLITQRIAKVIKSYLATHPSVNTPTLAGVGAPTNEEVAAASIPPSVSTPPKPTEAVKESSTTQAGITTPPLISTAASESTESQQATASSAAPAALPPFPEAQVYESEAESVASKTRGSRRTGRTPSVNRKNPRSSSVNQANV